MSRVGSPQNVCFYSNNCKWSKAFLTELAKTPYKKDFAFHCVDPSPNRPPLPTWLKKVPTLIVQGEQEPLTDGEVMNWLSIKKLRDNGGGNNGPPVPTRGPQGQAQAQIQQEPEAYMWGEMGGSLTKPFSFVDNSGDAPQGNFEYLNGGQPAPGTRTGSDIPEFGSRSMNQPKSRKEDLFDKQMQSYMSSRDSGMPPPVARM